MAPESTWGEREKRKKINKQSVHLALSFVHHLCFPAGQFPPSQAAVTAVPGRIPGILLLPFLSGIRPSEAESPSGLSVWEDGLFPCSGNTCQCLAATMLLALSLCFLPDCCCWHRTPRYGISSGTSANSHRAQTHKTGLMLCSLLHCHHSCWHMETISCHLEAFLQSPETTRDISRGLAPLVPLHEVLPPITLRSITVLSFSRCLRF